MLELFTVVGFCLAGFSVIANDSVQTLGTWIASNRDKFKWTTLWAAASAVLIFTLVYGWVSSGNGDISFGRLTKIPYQEPQWYHALAPLALVLLTRKGIPVSTSFLVLSAFASTFVLEKMLMKSIMGYGLAAVVAYALWLLISKIVDEKEDVSEKSRKVWRVLQWSSTGFLWFTWLSHDVANIAVFLPRELTVMQLILVIVFFHCGSGLHFLPAWWKNPGHRLGKAEHQIRAFCDHDRFGICIFVALLQAAEQHPNVHDVGICRAFVWS